MPNFPDIEAGKNFIGKFSLGEVRKSDDFSYFCGMQKYIEYISDLLYLHDCVIIPDFGGFICNYTGAYIDETNGTICPPAKEILFNRNLTHNDGLLAGWIAARENIPYEKATQVLALFADDLKNRLNRRERVPFGEIGVFYVDRRFNILFESGDRNFLAESFGMEPIAVRETGQNHPVEINLPQPAALHVPAPQPGKHIVRRLQRTVKYGVAAAAVAGVAVCGYALFAFFSAETASLFSTTNDVTVEKIGQALMGTEKFEYLLPFEAISVLLLACIIGGVTIARKR